MDPKRNKIIPEDLKKFSYLLVGLVTFNGEDYPQPLGTCFFIKIKKVLFLITAKHNFTGRNTFNKAPTGADYDTLAIRIYNSQTKENNFFSIPIAEIKAQIPIQFFYENPDYIGIPAEILQENKDVHSIEPFFRENVQNDKIIQVVSHGFPFEDPAQFNVQSESSQYSGKIADETYKDPHEPINDDIYYLVSPKTYQGMSGAPVFLRCKSKKDKTEYFRFGGVLFGTNATYDSTYVVNGKLVKDELYKRVL